jgi:hypothetical protein
MTMLAPQLNLARTEGVLLDPWALARLGRRELANAAVLAGLWSRSSGGDIAIQFLSAFFERLRPRPGGDALPGAKSLAQGYRIRTEDEPMGDLADRVDITVEGSDFLVGIEVKIDAGFQPDQLGRYIRSIGRRAGDRGKQPIVICLAPSLIEKAGVVLAGWADIAAAARSITPKRPNRTINHHVIERFAAHVARF